MNNTKPARERLDTFRLQCIDDDAMHFIRVSRWDPDDDPVYLELIHVPFYSFWQRLKLAARIVFRREEYLAGDYILEKTDIHGLVAFLQKSLKDIN